MPSPASGCVSWPGWTEAHYLASSMRASGPTCSSPSRQTALISERGSARLSRNAEARYAAQPQVVADVLRVLGELVPQGGVRRPGNRIVAVEPALAEGDPHQRPVRGVFPPPVAPVDQRAANLERRSGGVGEGGCRMHRPNPEIVRHQVELEVIENGGIDQRRRHVLEAL